MFKKEAQRLENSIVLSIQYSRMLEEISDTNLKIDVAHGKKIVLAKGNQICDYENYINKENLHYTHPLKNNHLKHVRYTLFCTHYTLNARRTKPQHQSTDQYFQRD